MMSRDFFGIRLVPMNWRWLDARSIEFNHAPLWRKPLIALHIAVTLIRRVLRLGPSVAPMRYPRGGSQAMIDRLCALAREVGAEVRLATEITGVEADTEHGFVTVRQGDTVLEADELVFTSGSKLSDVIVDGRRVDFDDAPQNHSELLLLLEDDSPRRFSFVAMAADDPLLHMLSDITPYTDIDETVAKRPLKSVTVRMRGSCPATNDIADQVVSRLAELGLIDATARLIHHHWLKFAIPHRRKERVKELNQACGPCIRGLDTYGFSTALLDQKERWKPTLDWLRGARAEQENGAAAEAVPRPAPAPRAMRELHR